MIRLGHGLQQQPGAVFPDPGGGIQDAGGEIPTHAGNDHRIHAARCQAVQSGGQHTVHPVIKTVIRQDLPCLVQRLFVDITGIAMPDDPILGQVGHQLPVIGTNVRHHAARLDHAGDLSQSIAQFYQGGSSCFECPKAGSQLSCLLYHTFREIPTQNEKAHPTCGWALISIPFRLRSA